MSASHWSDLADLHRKVALLFERRDQDAILTAHTIVSVLNTKGLDFGRVQRLTETANSMLDKVQPLVTCATDDPQHTGPSGVHRRRHSCTNPLEPSSRLLAVWESVCF